MLAALRRGGCTGLRHLSLPRGSEERFCTWLCAQEVHELAAACPMLTHAACAVRCSPLDAAAAAAFVALLWPRIQARQPIAIAAVAAVVTIIAVPTTPAGVPILIAAAAGLLMALVSERSRA